MTTIPDAQREQFECMVREYADEYGPWAVLLLFTETMRNSFRELAAEEAVWQPKRARKLEDKAGPMAPVRNAHLEVMRLNAVMPEGTPVIYYPGPREHGGRECEVRGKFFLTGVNDEIGGWVTGQAGYVRASHIEKR